MKRIAWLAVAASVWMTQPLFAQDAPAPAKAYRPSAGDLMLFRHDSLFMNGLAACTLSVGTSHVGIVVKRHDGTYAIFETPYVGSPVQFCEIHERISTYRGQVSVRHPLKPLTEEQSSALTEFAYAQLGKGYDYVGFFALPVSMPIRFLAADNASRELTDPSRWFCSSLAVAGCCVGGQLDIGVANPRGACADDLRSDLILDLSGSYAPPIGLRVNSK